MKSLNLLKKISFERIGGTEEELKACEIIKEEISSFSQNLIEIEEFEIDDSNILKSELEVIAPYNKKYIATGVLMSDNALDLEGELVYVENQLETSCYNISGKIALVHSRITYKLYEVLLKAKVKAIICASGSIYDDVKNSDLEVFKLRENHYKFGKVPCLAIRIKDLEEILESNAKIVRINLKQEEIKKTSRNLLATIKGQIENEFICLTAHYDSVKFSTGAYDNGSGAVGLVDLYKYYSKNKPLRTLKFIWCGSEEFGLLGSKYYCSKHKEELKNCVLNINLDMIGVVIGYEYACCTANMNLVNYINYLSKEVGFPILVKQGVYSSDSTPFADINIPAISFARLAPNGGMQIHSRKDIINFIKQDYINKTINFIIIFLDRMINSKVFPVEKEIPENMKEEIDKYYLRTTSVSKK